MPTIPSGAAEHDRGTAGRPHFTVRALADLLSVLRELQKRRADADQASDNDRGAPDSMEPRR